MAEDEAVLDRHLVEEMTSFRGGVWYCGEGPQKGYYFRVNKRKNDVLHLQCVNSACPVRAAIDLNQQGYRLRLRITDGVHQHQPQEMKEYVAIRRKLLYRSGKERGDLKRIHMDEIIK